MGSESALNTACRRAWPNSGHYVRIENSLGAGTPDVWLSHGLVHGWVELKYSKAWPKRPNTIVRLEHFTVGQQEWLIKEGLAGGAAAVLWQVGSEYLIIPWWFVGSVGEVSRARLYGLCVGERTNRLSEKWLTDNLSKCRRAIRRG